MTRRAAIVQLLGVAAFTALALRSRRSLAATLHDVSLAELSVPGAPATSQAALAVLAGEINANTSVRVAQQPRVVAAEPAALVGVPLLFWTGRVGFDPLPDSNRQALGRWVAQGGMLVVDDRAGEEESPFWASVQRELSVILPGRPAKPLGADHAVYRSFFLTDNGAVGAHIVRPYLLGIGDLDASPVIISRNDIMGCLEQGPIDDAVADGPLGNAAALAINIVLYAITTDYKLDSVHVKTLMQRMRREGGRK